MATLSDDVEAQRCGERCDREAQAEAAESRPWALLPHVDEIEAETAVRGQTTEDARRRKEA
jgi:hypothetical protein